MTIQRVLLSGDQPDYEEVLRNLLKKSIKSGGVGHWPSGDLVGPIRGLSCRKVMND
jgi:hypothetical protein